MGDSSRDVFTLLFQLIYYVSLLCQVGIAVFAFVRLKTTFSGLLIGGGFGLSVVLSLLFKVLITALRGAGSGGDVAMAMMSVRSALHILAMLVVVIGVVLIPASLQKLAKAG